MLLHGEGVVLFDRGTLAPTKFEIFVWKRLRTDVT
jgi:hypothetical protein